MATLRYRIQFLLFLCLWRNESNQLSRIKIIEEAGLLCTEHEICSTNSSTIGTVHDTNVCCTYCSCEPDCKDHENCCFPDQAYPNGNGSAEWRDERRILENETTLIYECLYASSSQPNDSIGKIEQRSVWMISDVVHNRTGSRNQKCGQQNVAPWGTLLPVSSKKTGYIYKNIYCAKEHGVKEADIVVWEGSHVFNKRRPKNFNFSEAYLDSSQKRFYAPPGIIIRRSSLCFKGLIDTCPEKEFDMPRNIDMNHSEIINACTSGFLSPYLYIDMFANIFCHICNNHPLLSFRCPSLSVHFKTPKSGGRMSGLINYKYLQGLSRDHGLTLKRSSATLACVRKGSDEDSVTGACRVIHCPIGQRRNYMGKCFFGTLRWYNIVFRIIIQLTSDKPINIRLFFPETTNQRAADISNLESSFLKYLKIESVYYKQLMSLNDTNEILIVMSTPATNSNVKLLLNEVTRIIKKKWSLHLQNETLTLKARMLREIFTHRENMFRLNMGTSYHKIYFKALRSSFVLDIWLTKLYFCKNILLDDREFNISDKGIVFDKVSNRYLYSAEYSLVKSEQGLYISCYVCLRGSRFYVQQEHKTSVGKSPTLTIFSVIPFLVVSLL